MYAGKVYDSGQTEIYSKALEYFIDSQALRKLYRQDPEHYHLALGALLSDRKLTPPPEQQAKIVEKVIEKIPKQKELPVSEPLSSEEAEKVLPKGYEVVSDREKIINRRESNVIKNLNINTALTIGGGATAATGGVVYGARKLRKKEKKEP